MKYFISHGLVIVCLSVVIAPAQDGPQAAKLATIRKIYIGDLGREEGADLVREKIRIRLLKSQRFSVVEHAESADAILTGAAGVVRTYNNSVNGGSTSFQGTGILRLLDVRTDETVWLFEYKRGFSFGSASSRVADQVVDRLLKDAQPRSERKKK